MLSCHKVSCTSLINTINKNIRKVFLSQRQILCKCYKMKTYKIKSPRRRVKLITKMLRKLPKVPASDRSDVAKDADVEWEVISEDNSQEDEERSSKSEKANVRYISYPAGVIWTELDYVTIPSKDNMLKYMRPDGSCVVPWLEIDKTGVGNVFFPYKINVAGLDLDLLMYFLTKKVLVFPYEAEQTSVGISTERRAVIMLYNIWPTDKSQKKPITDPDRLLKMDYEGRLRRICDKRGYDFWWYNSKTGSWRFCVHENELWKEFNLRTYLAGRKGASNLGMSSPNIENNSLIKETTGISSLPATSTQTHAGTNTQTQKTSRFGVSSTVDLGSTASSGYGGFGTNTNLSDTTSARTQAFSLWTTAPDIGSLAATTTQTPTFGTNTQTQKTSPFGVSSTVGLGSTASSACGDFGTNTNLSGTTPAQTQGLSFGTTAPDIGSLAAATTQTPTFGTNTQTQKTSPFGVSSTVGLGSTVSSGYGGFVTNTNLSGTTPAQTQGLSFGTTAPDIGSLAATTTQTPTFGTNTQTQKTSPFGVSSTVGLGSTASSACGDFGTNTNLSGTTPAQTQGLSFGTTAPDIGSLAAATTQTPTFGTNTQTQKTSPFGVSSTVGLGSTVSSGYGGFVTNTNLSGTTPAQTQGLSFGTTAPDIGSLAATTTQTPTFGTNTQTQKTSPFGVSSTVGLGSTASSACGDFGTNTNLSGTTPAQTQGLSFGTTAPDIGSLAAATTQTPTFGTNTQTQKTSPFGVSSTVGLGSTVSSGYGGFVTNTNLSGTTPAQTQGLSFGTTAPDIGSLAATTTQTPTFGTNTQTQKTSPFGVSSTVGLGSTASSACGDFGTNTNLSGTTPAQTQGLSFGTTAPGIGSLGSATTATSTFGTNIQTQKTSPFGVSSTIGLGSTVSSGYGGFGTNTNLSSTTPAQTQGLSFGTTAPGIFGQPQAPMGTACIQYNPEVDVYEMVVHGTQSYIAGIYHHISMLKQTRVSGDFGSVGPSFKGTSGFRGFGTNTGQFTFGTTPAQTPRYSFGNTTPIALGQQKAPTGTARVKYNPLVGTEVVVKYGSSLSIHVKHQCITLMNEYENKSLEELRLEDYMAGRKGAANTGMSLLHRGGFCR